jgi:HPt (histidine-containing phosphotransfer) domain-containing protein
MDIMGFSLKSATVKLLAFPSPAPAGGSSSVLGLSGRKPGTPLGATARDQAQKKAPRRNRTRINREPVLDRSRLEDLAGELRSWTSFVEYVNLFLVLLPHRVDGVISALDGADTEAARDAVLSLASSAAMTGACRLELVASLIDDDLRAGRVNRARETGRRLVPDAEELASVLSPLLAGR